MKVQVINEFVDKHSQELHPIGEVFDVTDKRLAEIQGAGSFVKVLENKEEPASSESEKEQKVRGKKKGE